MSGSQRSRPVGARVAIAVGARTACLRIPTIRLGLFGSRSLGGLLDEGASAPYWAGAGMINLSGVLHWDVLPPGAFSLEARGRISLRARLALATINRRDLPTTACNKTSAARQRPMSVRNDTPLKRETSAAPFDP